MALSDENLERAGKTGRRPWQHILRPRTLLYTVLWAAVGVGLTAALFLRSDIELTVAPVRNPTFVTLSDGDIRNTYEVRLLNKYGEPRRFDLSVASDVPLALSLEGEEGTSVTVPADSTYLQRVYVIGGAGGAAAEGDRTELRLWVEDPTSKERAYKDTIFNGKASR